MKRSDAGSSTCPACKTCCSQSTQSGSCPNGSTFDATICTVSAGYFSKDEGVTCSQCLAGNYSKKGKV